MYKFDSISPNKIRLLTILGLIASLALWLNSFFFQNIFGKRFLLPFNGSLLIFSSPYLSLLWGLLSVFIPFFTLLLLRNNSRSISPFILGKNPYLQIFSPLVLLPLSTIIFVFQIHINPHIPANVLFYVSVFVFSLIIYRAVEHIHHSIENPKKINGKIIIGIGIFFMIFSWLTGWYFTLHAGEHSGDEGHYIIQAKSLYYDDDLDLFNNFDVRERKLLEQNELEYLHISSNSREGKFYSWHPFGLPAYLSILNPDVLGFRHLLMGILSGLGSAGLLILCRLIGVSRSTSLLFVFLTCFSVIWGIYASRVLPEFPGAVLTIWLSIALLCTSSKPWMSSLLIIICCSYLPFLHPRFIPVSLFGFVFYLISNYLSGQFLHNRLAIVFTSLSLVIAAFGYLYINSQLFTTFTSYTSDQFSFYPTGMWEVIMTNRGIVTILPSFTWLLTASLLFLFFCKQRRLYCYFCFSVFLGVLAISCSNHGWHGGASAIGRYLLVVFPLFLPMAAYVYERTNNVAKWWFIFLAIISVYYFILLLFRLELFYGNFSDPRYFIGKVYEYYQGLINPFPQPWLPFISSLFLKSGYLFPLTIFVLTFILLIPQNNRKSLFLIPAVISAVAILCNQPDKQLKWESMREKKQSLQKNKNASSWKDYNLDRSFMLSRKPFKQSSLFAVSDLFSIYSSDNLPSVTTDPEVRKTRNGIIYQPEMSPNDWHGNPHFWTTLVTPFLAKSNKTAFYLKGEISGDTEIIFVIVELGGKNSGNIIVEKKFDTKGPSKLIEINRTILPTGSGKIHILINIRSGEGTFICKEVKWSPFNHTLLEKTKTYLQK